MSTSAARWTAGFPALGALFELAAARDADGPGMPAGTVGLAGMSAAGTSDRGHPPVSAAARELATQLQQTGLRNPVVEHVRYKPGRSVIARLAARGAVESGDADPDSGGSGPDSGGFGPDSGDQQPWWFAAYAPRQLDKVDKVDKRAAQSGFPLVSAELAGHPGHQIQCGPIGLDKNLFKPLERAGLVDPSGQATGTVLSYNPWRRLVIRCSGTAVARVWAEPPTTLTLLPVLHDRGAPVLPVQSLTSACVVHPWASGGSLTGALRTQRAAAPQTSDNAAPPAPDTVALLGRVAGALARLHATDLAGTAPAATAVPMLDAHGALATARAGVRSGLPELLDAYDATAGSILTTVGLDPGPAVLVHGDFSVDQVVLDLDGEPVLIDLDRMGRAPAGYDLGSYAAVELLRGGSPVAAADFVEAYRERSGAGHITWSGVRAWTAFHLLLRVTEPFRALDPRCADRARARIALALECTAGVGRFEQKDPDG